MQLPYVPASILNIASQKCPVASSLDCNLTTCSSLRGDEIFKPGEKLYGEYLMQPLHSNVKTEKVALHQLTEVDFPDSREVSIGKSGLTPAASPKRPSSSNNSDTMPNGDNNSRNYKLVWSCFRAGIISIDGGCRIMSFAPAADGGAAIVEEKDAKTDTLEEFHLSVVNHGKASEMQATGGKVIKKKKNNKKTTKAKGGSMNVAKFDHNDLGCKHCVGSFSPSMSICSEVNDHTEYNDVLEFLNLYFEQTDSGLAVELKKEDDILLTEAGCEEDVDTQISNRCSISGSIHSHNFPLPLKIQAS